MSGCRSPIVNRKAQRLGDTNWSCGATSLGKGPNIRASGLSYYCGSNVILYISKTSKNPNGLLLGCPYFKVS